MGGSVVLVFFLFTSRISGPFISQAAPPHAGQMATVTAPQDPVLVMSGFRLSFRAGGTFGTRGNLGA